MNTHDIDIELPPLPPLNLVPSVEPVDYPEVAQVLLDYARRAIEAALQSQDREDADRLNWIEEQYGADLVCFDSGSWEVSTSGVYGEGSTLREAIDHARCVEEKGNEKTQPDGIDAGGSGCLHGTGAN